MDIIKVEDFIIKTGDNIYQSLGEVPEDLAHFIDWVEQTQLFNVIKEETNKKGWNGVMPQIVGMDGSISLSLKPDVIINKATDLPKEVLLSFFISSPFYK